MEKINKNFIYNAIYQIFTFIVPLITIPYISRVLGVNNIGIYSYSYSIVYYFMLITLLGINNHGLRNVSRVSDDKDKRSFEFWSIYLLQFTIGILMIVIYNLCVILFIKENKTIFFIQNMFLGSAILDINWYFFGRERFKLTISRNVIIKLLSLVLVFLLVKKARDLWIYTIIMSGSTLISQSYLWLFIRKDVVFKKISVRDVISNLKPCLLLFIPVIAYSIYKVMDKTMLGALSGTIALGYYENAEKVINIPISLITALGTVILPHMSKNNSKESIINNMTKTFKLTFFIIVPMLFGIFVVSEDFCTVFFGVDFLNSSIIMKLLAPTVLFTSIANIIRTNFLIPQKRDKVYVISTVIGAIINLIINALLIPKFSYYGACVGTIFAEFTVMLIQLLYAKKELKFSLIASFLPFFIKGIIMFVVIYCIKFFVNAMTLRLFLQILIAVVIYGLLNIKYLYFEFFNRGSQIKK